MKSKIAMTYLEQVTASAKYMKQNMTVSIETLNDLEDSIVVEQIVKQYGELPPLKFNNRRFHKVAEDIRSAFACM